MTDKPVKIMDVLSLMNLHMCIWYSCTHPFTTLYYELDGSMLSPHDTGSLFYLTHIIFHFLLLQQCMWAASESDIVHTTRKPAGCDKWYWSYKIVIPVQILPNIQTGYSWTPGHKSDWMQVENVKWDGICTLQQVEVVFLLQ